MMKRAILAIIPFTKSPYQVTFLSA